MMESIINFFTNLSVAEIALLVAFGMLVVDCLFAIPFGISILCSKKQPNDKKTNNNDHDVSDNDLEDVAEEGNNEDVEETNETALDEELAEESVDTEEELSDVNTEPEESETLEEVAEEDVALIEDRPDDESAETIEEPIAEELTDVVDEEQPEEINEDVVGPTDVVEDTAVVDTPEEVIDDRAENITEVVEETVDVEENDNIEELVEETDDVLYEQTEAVEEAVVVDELEDVSEVAPEEDTILEEVASDEIVIETEEELTENEEAEETDEQLAEESAPAEVEEHQESEESSEEEIEEPSIVSKEVTEVEETEHTEELVEETEDSETITDENDEAITEETEQPEETTETEEVIEEQPEDINNVADEQIEVVPEIAVDESEVVAEGGEHPEEVSEVVADVIDEELNEVSDQDSQDNAEENSNEPAELLVNENVDISLYEPEVVDGFVIFNAFKRSFLSRLIQASETNQNYYSEIKNRLLSHKKVRNRLSWGAESFRLGRALKAKMTIRGKTLCLFLALNPDDFDKNIYHQRNFGDRKKYAYVPLMLRVRSPLGLKRALRLIDVLLENVPLDKRFEPVVYSYPYETDEELIEKDLIRRIRAKRFVDVHEDETVDEAVVRIVTETQSAQFIESEDESELFPEEITELENEQVEFAELEETEDEENIPTALEDVQKDEPEFAEESAQNSEEAPAEFETPVVETPETFVVEDERAVGAPVIDNDEVAPLFVGNEEEETTPESVEQTDGEQVPDFVGIEEHSENLVPNDLENEETVAPDFAGFEEDHKETLVPDNIKQEEPTAPEFAELEETEDEAIIPTALEEVQEDEPEFAEESAQNSEEAPAEFETPVEEIPEPFVVEDERAVGAPVIDNDEVAPLFVGNEEEETISESIEQADGEQVPDFAGIEEHSENVVPNDLENEETVAPDFAGFEEEHKETLVPGKIKQEETTVPEFAEFEENEEENLVPDEIKEQEKPVIPEFAEEATKDSEQAPTEFKTPVEEITEPFVVEDERAVGAPVIDNDEVAPLFVGNAEEETIPENIEQTDNEQIPEFADFEDQGDAFAPSEIKGKKNVIAPEFAGMEEGEFEAPDEFEAPAEFDAPQVFEVPEDKDVHPDTINCKQHKLDKSEDINPEFAEGDESELPPDAFENIVKAESETLKTEETPKQKPVKAKFEERIGVPRGLYDEVPEEKKKKPKKEDAQPKNRVLYEGLTKEEQRLIAENEALLAGLMESEEEFVVNEENHEIVGVCTDTSEFNNFEMKLYNASNNIKYYYSEIKNTLLSYKKIKCKQSNAGDSFRQGTNLVARITLNGNKLRLHLSLNPKDYSENVYNHYSMADKNAYKDVPLTLLVTKRSDLKICAKLIQDAMASKYVIYLDKKREWVDYAALYTKKED